MRPATFLFVGIALAGCNASGVGGGKDGLPDGFGPSRLPEDEAVPEFGLLDINPNSARSGETVAPSDYLDQISAWYFGHAT